MLLSDKKKVAKTIKEVFSNTTRKTVQYRTEALFSQAFLNQEEVSKLNMYLWHKGFKVRYNDLDFLEFKRRCPNE